MKKDIATEILLFNNIMIKHSGNKEIVEKCRIIIKNLIKEYEETIV